MSGRFCLLLGKQDGTFDQLKICQTLPELLLHMQEAISLDAARQRHRERSHELAFCQAAHRGLMAGIALQPRSREQAVYQRDIAVQEYSVPRDENIVKEGERIGLLEARAQ